jgi:hypothetical protein
MIIAPIAKSSIVLVLCKRSCCSGAKMNSKFSQWLNECFLEWEKQQGKRQTVSAFAISRPPIADPDVIYIASVWNRLSDTDRETIISTIKDKVK